LPPPSSMMAILRPSRRGPTAILPASPATILESRVTPMSRPNSAIKFAWIEQDEQVASPKMRSVALGAFDRPQSAERTTTNTNSAVRTAPDCGPRITSSPDIPPSHAAQGSAQARLITRAALDRTLWSDESEPIKSKRHRSIGSSVRAGNNRIQATDEQSGCRHSGRG
jgi:hypothetical protein